MFGRPYQFNSSKLCLSMTLGRETITKIETSQERKELFR